MLSILLPFLVLSKEYKYPKLTCILVGSGFSQKDADDYNKDRKNNKVKRCEYWSSDAFDPQDRMDYDDCIALLSSLIEYKYSDGSNFNNFLSGVSKATEYLYIEGSDMDELDFSHLKSQMKVHLYYSKPSNFKKMDKMQFYKSLKNKISSISTQAINNNKNIEASDNVILPLNGNIKEKVSFLSISGASIKIINDDLNIHSFYLLNSRLSSDSKQIKTNFFLVDKYQYDDNMRNIKYDVDQFSFIPDFRDAKKYEVIYTNKSIDINYTRYSQELKLASIPYEHMSIFNVISEVTNIVITLEDGVNPANLPGLNISVMEEPSTDSPMSKQLSSNPIEITLNGWENVEENNKPKVTLTYDKEKYSYSPSEGSSLKITPEDSYEYQPQNKPDDSGPKSKGKSNVGMIVGIVVAVVVAIVIVIVVVIIVIRKKKAKQGSASEGENDQK